MMKELLSKDKTLIMGILNITPDSLSGDGLMTNGDYIDNALKQAEAFVNAGADILDVGGESTRPGATPVSIEEELKRVIPVIKALKKHTSVPLSIDTTKAAVANAAIQHGAVIINDVSGLMKDPNMVKMACHPDVYVVLMHSNPNRSVEKTNLGGRYLTSHYKNVVEEIFKELEQLTFHAISHGIKKEHIIVDVGIGFSKR